MELILLFTALTTLNVIVSTVKSIVTIKCGKLAAALINAVAYGINTVAIIYTVADMNLWVKVAVVGVTNFIGVYVVKLIEEKSRKEKLWKIECTVLGSETDKLHTSLNSFAIPHSYFVDIGKYTIFNIFCSTKEDTTIVHSLLKRCNAKYFVTEGKEI